jgi:hypothetical protein
MSNYKPHYRTKASQMWRLISTDPRFANMTVSEAITDIQNNFGIVLDSEVATFDSLFEDSLIGKVITDSFIADDFVGEVVPKENYVNKVIKKVRCSVDDYCDTTIVMEISFEDGSRIELYDGAIFRLAEKNC